MNNIFCSEFKRKFSISLYKNLKIKMGEMSFFKDFVNDTRGDPYPIIEKSNDLIERIERNRYTVKKGLAERLFCQFFHYGSYELNCYSDGEAGFCFKLPDAEARITVNGGQVKYCSASTNKRIALPCFVCSEFTMIVTCRPGAFDVYFKNNSQAEYLCTFRDEAFKDSNLYSAFSNGYVHLIAADGVTVSAVSSYVDNGISLADIRPIKYENGEAIFEGGRVYFSASVRMQEGSFQGVFSWIPGTAVIDMTGVLFYDSGDGRWRGYLAPVILFNRIEKKWYVWVSSFEHEHVLAYGSFDGDPRFGVNVVDVRIMDKATDTSDITAFLGFVGDEDPDLIYDAESKRWLMAVCRLDPKTNNYVYVFFESAEPFSSYKYIGRGKKGAETGGSFVRVRGELYFVCGNDFDAKSEYRVYSKDGMQLARFNYPDGGFRGWGTVVPIRLGSRTRYFWLTFDRHNGSEYRWSYGNLYCFEL
ncbi:MAG: hypothetical protein IJY69_04635 [Clostridia bacterium]|nr:hypothetical protein [Clostridia bacterium]